MKINFSFNKIYVIESLKQGEIKTGKNIYNDLIRWKTLNTDPLYSEYIEVSNKKSFNETMLYINSKVEKGVLPFIHFEMHGSDDKKGLVLNSDELVSWEELGIATRIINISTKNNLIVSLATCYGAFFLSSIDMNKEAPFSCFISTIEEVSTYEIEMDFTAFFETVLSTTDFNLAVANLNKSNKNPNKYHFLSAEEFLEKVLQKMEQEDFNLKNIIHRNWVNSVTKKLRNTTPEYAQLKKKKVKELVRNQLMNQGSSLRSEMKKSFLMISSPLQ